MEGWRDGGREGGRDGGRDGRWSLLVSIDPLRSLLSVSYIGT